MHDTLTIIASLIAIAGTIPYLYETIKGKTKPNIVTWLTWTLINGINMAAAFSDGAYQTALFSLAGTVATGSIVLVGLRNGIKHYTRFDAICQVVALLGIPLWLLTDQPVLAVIIVLLVDFAGGLPTVRHAWRAPHEETWQLFACSAVAGVMLLLSLKDFSFIAVAMPLYILLFDLTLLGILYYRPRQVAVKNKGTV